MLPLYGKVVTMDQLTQFKLLSTSKLKGMTTCRYMNGQRHVITKSNFKDFMDAMKLNRLKQIESDMKKYQVMIKEVLLPIYDPPKFLWLRGRGNIGKPMVAVIGARKCSEYGRKIAYKIGYELGKANVQVISGMAYGIDYMAHKGCVDAGGSTIAVLGSGVLNIYPKSHEKLYQDILKNGLIVSEYGMWGKPYKQHFPFRNRLISGFADVVIVVEAKAKSGTMITVNYGLDQGKSIVAVPGPVDSIYSEGTNALIKEGASVYTSIDDILQLLP